MDGTKIGDDIIVVETSNEAFRRSGPPASHSRYYHSINHYILTFVDIAMILMNVVDMMIEIDVTETGEMMIDIDIESVLIVEIADLGPDHQEDIEDMMIIHIRAMIDIAVIMFIKRVAFNAENLDI